MQGIPDHIFRSMWMLVFTNEPAFRLGDVEKVPEHLEFAYQDGVFSVIGPKGSAKLFRSVVPSQENARGRLC